MMIRAVLSALLTTIAVGAQAQDFPTLFDVIGVVEGDVLRVHAATDAASEVVATLPAGQTNIEVLARDASKTWGLVSVYEANTGWVPLAMLAQVDPDVNYATDFDRPLWCEGSEPFWRLQNRADGNVVWNDALSTDKTFQRAFGGTALNRGRLNQMMFASSVDAYLTVTLRQENCDAGYAVVGF